MRLLLIILLSLPFAASVPAFERRTPIVAAVEKAGPAVVNIRTEQVVKRRTSLFGFTDPFFDDFFRDLTPPQLYRTQSLGSGVIVDARGYVLTNAHVIEKASKIFVALPNGIKELEAKLVGADEHLDLAVLRIEGLGRYPFLPLASSSDLLLGESVIAIGNPLGLGHSITTGVVSAPNRRLSLAEGMVSIFVQTDALINPGNSGGPLLNINGELIGINTAIAQQAQGIGFSIPSDVARRVLGELIAYGRVRPPYFGIIPGSVNRALVRAREEGGVLVTEIDPGSPAASAGLQLADVILRVNGLEVESPSEFLNLVSTYPPESLLRISLLRGTRETETKVRLSTLPDGYVRRYAERMFGLKVAADKGGVAVAGVSAGSSAEKAGIRRGDRIAEVDGEKIDGVDDYLRLLAQRLGQLPVSFVVVRGNRGFFLTLP